MNAGAYLVMDGDVVQDARIALGAAAPTPLLLEGAAQALIGRRLEDASIEAASAEASAAAQPITDMRGTIQQRKHLAGVLTARVIRKAAARAQGEE